MSRKQMTQLLAFIILVMGIFALNAQGQDYDGHNDDFNYSEESVPDHQAPSDLSVEQYPADEGIDQNYSDPGFSPYGDEPADDDSY